MKHLLPLIVFLSVSMFAMGQKGSVKGTVFDKATGEGIPYATVKVDSTELGAATDEHGFFNIPNLPVGSYTLKISYIGYESLNETVQITKGQTANIKIYMKQMATELQSVEISAEKQRQRTETRVSVTSITPVEIRRLPAIGGEPDIAQYLQVLPGVVSTGDQGGQVVIRGGTPIQTRFLLDGITVYNPFHSIGLFSVYETDLVKNIDVYTGGFPAQYGGRTSAVVDVSTRDGNRKKVSGSIAANPFMAHALLEIPVVKLKEEGNTSASLILNGKVSYLEQSSKALYKYANKDGLPYNFYDFFGKFSLNAGKGNKFNITGFDFRDNTNFTDVKYGWENFGVGANFVAVPKNSNLSFNTHVSYSQYKIKMTTADNLPRSSSIGGFDIGMDFNYYIKNGELKYGLAIEGSRTQLAYTNQYLQKYTQDQNTTDFGAYFMFHKFMKKFVIEAGARLHYYGKINGISPEPRLSLKYNATNWLRFKLASGLYSQNFISSKSDRDVVNLFTGFVTAPDETPWDATQDPYKYDKIKRMQRSVHAIFGIELDLPQNITLNIEPYYKHFWHLFNVNRFKQFNNQPNFLVERGDAYGMDLTAKWEWKGFYLYGTYSLAWVTRFDGLQTYYPSFDRRHNANLLASYTFGKKRDWEISVRWNYGTGFPFTQTQSFYENLNFSDGIGTNYAGNNGALGIVYDSTINGGRLPDYHRLDFSARKIFNIKDKLKIEINISVSNVYNRKNIFYIDRVTFTRVNQLPVLPSMGLKISF